MPKKILLRFNESDVLKKKEVKFYYLCNTLLSNYDITTNFIKIAYLKSLV